MKSYDWNLQSAVVRKRFDCRDQYGRGVQRAAWRSAVVLRCNHGVYGKRLGSRRKCFTRLEYRGAIFYSACSPKNDAMLVVLMMVVWAFTLDMNDVVAEAGDAMDASANVKVSPKLLPRGLGGAKIQSSCVGRGTTTWHSRKVRVWATGKERTTDSTSANGTSAASLVWICIPETRAHSKQTNRFGRDDFCRHGEGRFGCAGDLFSVVSNRKNPEIRCGIDSCAAVIVFVPGK